MKISITQAQKDRITELRESLADTLAEMRGVRHEHTKAEGRAEQLRKEIAKLKDSAAPDRKIATALREAKDELELVETQIADLDHAATATVTPATERASGLMKSISGEITKALQSAMDARLDETSKLVRPLFTDDLTARGAAMQCPHYYLLYAYCSRRYGSTIGAPTSHIKSCLEFCDEVLSGELAFSFDPKTK